MNQKLVPMPSPFHSLWTNYRGATKRNNQQPHKKQQIYAVYHIYTIHIYLYISLNIRKYLVLVHCTKMRFNRGTKHKAFYGLKTEMKMYQRWEKSTAGFLHRVEICAVQWCVCNNVWWLCCTRQKGWHHWFEVGWLMDVFQHTHIHTYTSTQTHEHIYIHTCT